MINSLIGHDGICVTNSGSSMPYITPNPSNPLQGMIRMNGTSMEVYDGHGWTVVSGTCSSVRLDDQTKELLSWCAAQRTIALRRTEMAAKHPALEKALDAMKRAEENFEILSKFVENDTIED